MAGISMEGMSTAAGCALEAQLTRGFHMLKVPVGLCFHSREEASAAMRANRLCVPLDEVGDVLDDLLGVGKIGGDAEPRREVGVERHLDVAAAPGVPVHER